MAEPDQIAPGTIGEPNPPTGTERVDERDTMFARMARRPGTPSYVEYYGRRPELQSGDDRLRAMTPLLAVAAGLGELGRNNILVADRFGARVRIGAVTTHLPLRLDAPVDLGVRRFCGVCRKCAENCPAGALSRNGPSSVRGVMKWPTRVERCYAYWRAVGTDCGICMACCPFSHRDNGFHNLIRWVVRRWPVTHRTLKTLDDLVYGRRWRGQNGE
jgi:epoxyqueuosine reductase QueG